MDVLKSVAGKVKDGFAATLKKITDITTRGVDAAEHSDWQHVLGKSNPFCNDVTRILTFKQAMDLMYKSVPVIVDNTKKVVLIYNRVKPVTELPSQDDLDKIKTSIEENTDLTKCDGSQFGPSVSGNDGCNWSSSNTRQFITIYLKTAKTGLPQEVVKLTGEDKHEESAETIKVINEARWLVKAYGKCIAESSKTILQLAATCGKRDEYGGPTSDQTYVS